MKIISEEEFHRTLNNFFAETIKLVRLGNLTVIPLTANILSSSYRYILSHHIYQADAIQIGSAKASGASVLVSGDKSLVATAKDLKMAAYSIEEVDTILRLIG